VGRLSAVLTITYQDNNNKNCPSYPEPDLGRVIIVEVANVRGVGDHFVLAGVWVVHAGINGELNEFSLRHILARS